MEAKNYILVSYARQRELTEGEHRLDGVIAVFKDGKKGNAFPANNVLYKQLMTFVSSQLQLYPDHAVHFFRTDSHFPAQELSESNRVLLRDDPTAFINNTSPPPVRVIVSGSKPDPKPAPRLRAGLDALADAFGEVVYLRVEGEKVENPITGRWSTPGENDGIHVWLHTGAVAIRGSWIPRPQPNSPARWVAVRIDELLQTDVSRFYFPREWNPGGQWITRDELQKKFNAFRIEKASTEKELGSC